MTALPVAAVPVAVPDYVIYGLGRIDAPGR